jgi:hypothetical protein
MTMTMMIMHWTIVMTYASGMQMFCNSGRMRFAMLKAGVMLGAGRRRMDDWLKRGHIQMFLSY